MRSVRGNRRMQYHEYPPPPSLHAHVQCVWRLCDSSPAGSPRAIFPDGRCELIVHLAKPPRCWDAIAGWHGQTRALFAAQRIVAVRLEASGPVDCVGVRLQPANSNAAWPGAAGRYRDRIVNLAALDASFARALAAAARRFVRSEPETLWKLLEKVIGLIGIDERMAAAVRRIEVSGGRVRIDALARQSALSRRAFQMRFRAAVGLTAKEFARLTRLQTTLRALDHAEATVADVATESGFADQAHATRELRRVTGLTPARLRAALRRDRDGDATVRMAAAFVRGSG
jgi:AraC-like DNA-binding protein